MFIAILLASVLSDPRYDNHGNYIPTPEEQFFIGTVSKQSANYAQGWLESSKNPYPLKDYQRSVCSPSRNGLLHNHKMENKKGFVSMYKQIEEHMPMPPLNDRYKSWSKFVGKSENQQEIPKKIINEPINLPIVDPIIEPHKASIPKIGEKGLIKIPDSDPVEFVVIKLMTATKITVKSQGDEIVISKGKDGWKRFNQHNSVETFEFKETEQ